MEQSGPTDAQGRPIATEAVQIQVLQQTQDLENELVRERNELMKNLAADFSSVHELFSDVAQMVDEQQGDIDKIESNVGSAGEKVSEGRVELKRAEELQNAARFKLCIICIIVTILLATLFIVLLIMSAAFLLVLYSQLAPIINPILQRISDRIDELIPQR
jgi:t-SNARE complex subunit (syntaxin)